MMKIGEGAEAKIYSLRLFGRSLILKRRERKKYRISQLDDKLRKERTKREAKVMQKLSQIGVSSPSLVSVGKFSILMEKLDGRLLKDIKLNSEMLRQSGTILAKMHSHNIVHGDFTTANLMLSKDGISVIDFGLSEITPSIEEKASDLLLMKRSIPSHLYNVFENSYSSAYQKSEETKKRLKEIEERGRYQTRTLEAEDNDEEN